MELNIYAYKCKRCGHVQYPYRTVCSGCRENDHNEFDIVPLAKDGTLLTFTRNFTLPGDISASKRYFREDIVEPEFVLNPDSTLTVPTGPGIGVKVLMDRLERVTVRREEFRTVPNG